MIRLKGDGVERLTITISKGMAAKLRREARRRHVTVSQLVREQLGDLEATPGEPRRVIPWAGVGASGKPKLATQMDEELERTWADDLAKADR